MKKRRLKNYLKIGVFLFGVSALLWNCEKEESLELQSVENGNSFIRRAKLSTLTDLSSFVDRIQNGGNNLSRNSLEDANHFTILEDRDVFIYTNYLSTTYTLAIRKENQEPSSFSNLVVKFEENAATKASILNYAPTQQYLTAYNLDERAPFEGTVSYESLEYDGSLDHLDSRTQDCTDYSITYCNAPQTPGGSLITHIATEECNENYTWTWAYTICQEPKEIIPPPYDYGDTSGDPDPGTGGGGGDSGDGTTAPTPPCESTGSGTGISGADSDCMIVNPCDSIKSQMNDVNFSSKIAELKLKTGLTKENGYSQEKDSVHGSVYTQLQQVDGGHKVKIVVNRHKTFGYIHAHLDAIVTGSYALENNQIEEEPIHIFSPVDLIKFLGIVKNTKYNDISLSSVYATIVTSSGTRTLKFTGNIGDISNSLNAKDLEDDYKDIMEKYTNPAKGFLHFLNEHIRIEGIRLYRIKPNGDIVEEKLKADGSREEIPCS